ncbi:MAG: ABC transporter ATP-binding protein [bacterium]
MISLRRISKQYYDKNGKIKILDNIGFDLGRNEIIAILGPNGCGKTTLLKIIAGLEEYTDGEIVVHAQTSYRSLKYGFIFQNHQNSLYPWKTVTKNIKFAIRDKSAYKNQITDGILKDLNLSQHKNKYPYQLSGGMAQLTAIGRALAMQPDIFLLDEPFSALDYQASLIIQQKFLNIWQKTNNPTILVTHSIEEAIYLSDRILILSNLPAQIIGEIRNPLPRPRQIDHLGADLFNQIKKEVLQVIKGFLC